MVGGSGVALRDIRTVQDLYEDGELNKGSTSSYTGATTLNQRVSIWVGDLTQLKVGMIVNAANNTLLGGGGVDGAIHSVAGPELLKACRPLGGCPTGDAKVTPGFNLPAKYVAHAVGPIYNSSRIAGCEEALQGCYSRCMDLAVENGATSIAFPSISCGVYGYPLEAATSIALETVRKKLDQENFASISRVVFVQFSDSNHDIYARQLPRFFPAE